jgi:hypothetical protein
LDTLPVEERKRYFNFFGAVFERYVQNVCEDAFTANRFVRGFKYGRPEREAADGWIIYPGAAVVIEAKSARFTLDTRLSGSLGSVERMFRDSIVGGAWQLNRVIDDFRAGAFRVHGQGPAQLAALYPVLPTLEYVPLEHFLSDYIRRLLEVENLLQQPGVRPLVLLPIKEVEQIDGIIATGANFADVLQEYVGDPHGARMAIQQFPLQQVSRRLPDSRNRGRTHPVSHEASRVSAFWSAARGIVDRRCCAGSTREMRIRWFVFARLVACTSNRGCPKIVHGGQLHRI